jgi:type I restriction enzyme S subunit
METSLKKVKILDMALIANDVPYEFVGKRRYLATGHLEGDKIIGWEDVTYLDKPSRANLDVKVGDVIVARMKDTRKVLIIDKTHSDLIVSTGFVVLRPKENLDSRYLAYYLSSNSFQDEKDKLCTGATQKAINNANFEKLWIPLPPLSEQKEIVKELDRVNLLIQKRKESINLLDEYLKNVFLDMFGDPVNNEKGWKIKKGREYCEDFSVGVVVKPASYYVDKGVVALRSLNIKKNEISLDNVVYFSEEDNNKLSKSKLKSGDVLVVRTGITGTAAVVPEELDGVNCIDLIIVRLDKKLVNPHYLATILNSKRGKDLINSVQVGGIQKHFNIGAIRELKIPIPPIRIQNDFEDILNKVNLIKKRMLSELELIKSYQGGLVQELLK